MDKPQPPPHAHRNSPPENHLRPHQRQPPENHLRPHQRHLLPSDIPNRQFHRPYRDRPNFIVQLRFDGPRPVKEYEVFEIIQKLKIHPQKSNTVESNYISAALYFEQWTDALETIIQLWELKFLDKGHSFVPWVVCNVHVPSDKAELNDRLRTLFLEKLKGLMEGNSVEKWRMKLRSVVDELKRVCFLLKRPKNFVVYEELRRKKEGLNGERDLILDRLLEFKKGMECIVNYLENGQKDKDEVLIFGFSSAQINWGRIYRLIKRECRRLDDGLPIYSNRRKILEQIHCQQVTVLIGETGSGKSTQLVQFLADSGVSSQESIICTQPRKLAAISLAERVKEESCGCYDDNSVVCYPSYSSVQKFDSKVIFMTDHCLLQHYMNDKQLSKISCIIVDEAHERSLNTDLLLALIKKLLSVRLDLRLVIMSATANAGQYSNYFCGCKTLNVAGRNFPVDIRYVPCELEGVSTSKLMPLYVHEVLRRVTQINKETEKVGTILAFLTSQIEVEWACEKFLGPSAIALPLHGKLTHEEQHRVFLSYPGKRKVIFTTNVAETSLTIPGVKYVVDSGMAKQSRFEPATGMNVLRACKISQSSANQRAGRAGRTEPGTCYRLYTKHDFESMPRHQEPEIRMVHLGVAVLRMLALGIKDVKGFEFVDSPSDGAIDMATRNLIQLGAVALKNDVYDLTAEGSQMVKLGIEPRLGKIILQCFRHQLGREGLILAAVMANSSNIFCRVGTEEDKLKSDCCKVQFCHPNGDLFTLLAVYKAWESVPREKKNSWCWENSINAKSMRRCQDTALELEACLQNELNIIVPNYWYWDPQIRTEHDKTLKNVILSSLAENVAMFSGYDQLGYVVALTGKHVQLHPSCSLLNFGQRPQWVVFGEILSVSNEYLVCVTACEFESLSNLSPPPLFDFLNMESRQLQKKLLKGFGSVLLKRFCGKYSGNVRRLVSCIRASCADERIGVEVNIDQNEIHLYASSNDMEKVCSMVNDDLEYESKLLQNECLEKCLYNGGSSVLPSIALFGAGAEIKHLELEKRHLTVEISHSNINSLDDKELLVYLETFSLGHICAISRFSGDNVENGKWGRVTFLTPDAATKAVEINQFEFSGGLLNVVPSRNFSGGEHRMTSFPGLTARIFWPRRESRGVGIVRCDPRDVASMVDDFSTLVIGNRPVWCEASARDIGSVRISGLDRELSEAEIFQELTLSTNRRILDFFLLRGCAIDNTLPLVACEKAIRHEISPFMGRCVRVQVEQRDSYMRATITFDGSLHLEAARALEEIDGKVLHGCLPWQKMKCQPLFHSSVSCPAPVYWVIREQLDSLLASFQTRRGVECSLVRNQTGSYRVKISANATKTVADLRRPLEQLMKGRTLKHPDITPAVLQLLYSRGGITLMNSIQQEMGTYILFDKHNIILRVFGAPEKIDNTEQRLVKSLLSLHNSKELEIQLRNGVLPPDMMKRVVQNFGPNLNRLKEKIPEAEFTLNTRRHCISIVGTKEVKQKVEGIILDLAQTNELRSLKIDNNVTCCPICLCDLENPYMLENCFHKFCRLCLVEQCESAINNRDSFPLKCTKEGCGAPILLADLRSLLFSDKLEELFRASLGAFVAGSGGKYRFCPSPDCPSVYRAAEPGRLGEVFVCGDCLVETCTGCHLEYHPYLSCEKYREFKEDPDSSFKEWCSTRDNVKQCPAACGFTIEKIDGCNHIECKCGRHVCWVCLEHFETSDDCYGHLRSVHLAIV